MADKIKLKINGVEIEVEKGTRLIDAIRDGAGVAMPGVCYKKGSEKDPGAVPGSCRMCQVQIEGKRGTVTSCETFAKDGMSVITNTAEVLDVQRGAVGYVAEEHPGRCLDCSLLGCPLRDLVTRLNVEGKNKVEFAKKQRRGKKVTDLETGESSLVEKIKTGAIQFDESLCIKCGRCGYICPTGAIGPVGRGTGKRMGPPPGMELDVKCVNCGQCVKVCPTAALTEESDIEAVEEALADSTKKVFIQVAPAVRVALAEQFGGKTGEPMTGKMYAAFRRLGSNVIVADTNVSADLTILEEGTELLTRIKEGGKLPLITSCCPAWIKYAETFYPELLGNLSTCKSPQQMLGALAKTYYAKEMKVDPKDIVSVSVMPCTAKKFECDRPEMKDSGHKDVDYVLTTRELVRMIKARGLDLTKLPDEKADYPFEEYTGAGTIFGVTGGVMEAALRTVYKVVTGTEMEGVDFAPARGLDRVKEASVKLGDSEVKIAVAHGLKGDYIPKVLEDVKNGKSPYTFIEIMACPGGCIGGGGQPKEFDPEVKVERTEGIYKDDKSQRLRRSHESPVVQRIYDKFIEKPNSHKAHELLHTKYTDRSK